MTIFERIVIYSENYTKCVRVLCLARCRAVECCDMWRMPT